VFLPFQTHEPTQPTKNKKNIDPTQSNPTQPVGWRNPWTTLVQRPLQSANNAPGSQTCKKEILLPDLQKCFKKSPIQTELNSTVVRFLKTVYSDTTQLSSTSSWVELCRYERAFTRVSDNSETAILLYLTQSTRAFNDSLKTLDVFEVARSQY